MSAANKIKGATFELDLLRYLRAEGYDTERLRLAGKQDEGDLVLKMGGTPYILEAKATKVNNLTDFVRQARDEATNYARARGILPAPFAAVIKKRQAPISEAFVVIPLSEWLQQIKGN